MSDIEWLNFCIDEARNFGHAEKAGALERIRVRLTPDRERVARVLHDAEKGWSNNLDDARTWQAACADALIAAMEGK